MRIPLVMAPALVLAVGVVVGLASLGEGTDDDPAVEPITVRAPNVPAPGAAPLVPAAPPQWNSPAEPAPRDPAGYVAPPPVVAPDDDDDDAVDDKADDDKADDKADDDD